MNELLIINIQSYYGLVFILAIVVFDVSLVLSYLANVLASFIFLSLASWI